MIKKAEIEPKKADGKTWDVDSIIGNRYNSLPDVKIVVISNGHILYTNIMQKDQLSPIWNQNTYITVKVGDPITFEVLDDDQEENDTIAKLPSLLAPKC